MLATLLRAILNVKASAPSNADEPSDMRARSVEPIFSDASAAFAAEASRGATPSIESIDWSVSMPLALTEYVARTNSPPIVTATYRMLPPDESGISRIMPPPSAAVFVIEFKNDVASNALGISDVNLV
jgi:hypothetical protein